MKGRLVRTAQIALANLDISFASPRRVGSLVAHDGLMLEVEGLAQPVGGGVQVAMANGCAVRGEVVGFRNDRSLVLPFQTGNGYARGLRVCPDGASNSVNCGPALLGRVVDALGAPLDGKGPILGGSHWPLEGPMTNPLQRGRVTEVFDVGVRSINALLTMGVGQRVAIVAGSGVGKSMLMGQMLAGAKCDVLVVALVGERSREVSQFVETRLPAGVRERAVVVAVPADHPPHLRLRAAMRATAIAEYFRSQGQNILLMIDSLTRVAHAQREIGLALGEPPTMKGYPPSVLGTIPRLVERAGRDRHSGGAITAVYTVLADGGDMEDPIVDATRAIVDGHIVLSRALSEQGVFPAIDVGRSLSRTMGDVVDEAHMKAASRFRGLWSAYEDNRDLQLMGAYAEGTDILFDTALAQRPSMLELLRQEPDRLVSLESARTQLLDCMQT